MWKSLVDSNSDEVDEVLGKLELTLYNAVSLYNLIISGQQTSLFSPYKKYRIGSLRNIFNPVFRNIKTILTDDKLITNRLSLKMQKYYNLFTQDDLKCEKNRRKLIKQTNQVLEWLESRVNDYNRTKNPNIIIYRIFR